MINIANATMLPLLYLLGVEEGHSTHERSADIASPVPCRTGNRTGTWHWASSWRNKLHARIFSTFCHPCDSDLPLLVHAPHTRSPFPRTETTNGIIRRKYIRVKGRNLVEILTDFFQTKMSTFISAAKKIPTL